MNYLTNYYKNLSEQLQAKVNNLETFLNEANIRNPTDQRSAGFHRDKPAGWQNRRADQQPTNSYVPRYTAGWNRMDDMLHFKAAHAIADPREQQSIEAVLTDMANSGKGNAANMGHMRTAIGAVKRLKGTEAFAKSLSSVRAPIEQESLSRAQENVYSLNSAGMDDVKAGNLTPIEDEELDNQIFNVSQQHILGPRKKVDPRTAAIRQQPQLKRNSPNANPGRIM